MEPMDIDSPVVPSLLLSGQPIETLNYDTTVESYTDKEGKIWALPYRSDFMPFINRTFEPHRTSAQKFQEAILKSNLSGDDRPPPFKYQEFIYEYLKYGTPYRGLLLEHGLGSGKTRTAIMVAESFRAVNIPILVLTPAFLTTNFKSEIKKWFNLSDAEIDASYHFVSYNAGGRVGGQGSALEQLAKLGLGLDSDAFPYIAQTYPNLAPPKRWFIIIEEMHGLNRSFKETGQSKIRKVIYDLLMAAEDCKILGLSGTPMIEPHELGTMYNILRGPLSGTFQAFPENSAEFNRKFLAKDDVLMNKDVFCKRISGLHSYFKGVGADVSGRLYPKEHCVEITLEMSAYQKQCYEGLSATTGETDPVSSTFLCQERKLCNFAFPEGLRGGGYILLFNTPETTVPMFAAKYGIPETEVNTFLLNKERAIPIAEIEPYLTPSDRLIWLEVHGTYKQAVNARLNRLVNQHPEVFTLEGIKKYSPKMAKIFQLLSDPVQGAAHIAPGLAAKRVQTEDDYYAPPDLEYIGEPDTILDEEDNLTLDSITTVRPKATTEDIYLSDAELDVKYHRNWTVKGGPVMIYSFFSSLEGAGIFSKFLEAQGYEHYRSGKPALERKPRYAFIRGGMTAAQKVGLLNVFNHPSNKHGQIIKVMFVTLAAVEGISLFHLRQIHIMEPYWDRNIIRQVTGRGFRLKSHFHLPEDECRINVYEYAVTLPGRLSADVLIRNIADKKDRFQADFKKLRMSAAVDCALNINHHLNEGVTCFDWPTADGFIYHNDVDLDIGTTAAVEYDVPMTMEKITTKNGVLVWNPKEYFNIDNFNPATGRKETVTSVHQVFLENNLNTAVLYVKMTPEGNVFYRTRYTDKNGVEHIVNRK